MCRAQAGESLLTKGGGGGRGGEMQGRENPLQTPHLHVMEHLQNRDLPP